MNVVFEDAGTEHLDTILEMMRMYYYDERMTYIPEKARPALEELITHQERGRVWMIFFDHECVGYFIITYAFTVEFHGRNAVLDEMYIKEEYRDRGIGRHALEFMERFLKSEGIDVFRLEVEELNLRAARFFRENGFDQHERHLMTKYLQDHGERAKNFI